MACWVRQPVQCAGTSTPGSSTARSSEQEAGLAFLDDLETRPDQGGPAGGGEFPRLVAGQLQPLLPTELRVDQHRRVEPTRARDAVAPQLLDAIVRASGFRISNGFISPLDLVGIGLASAEEAKQLHDLETAGASAR
jgi:hypothetical protein